MKEISLRKGGVVLIDDSDLELLSQYSWYKETNGYIRGRVNGKIVSMHRLLLGLKFGDRIDVDHINGFRHDNRRANLRKCSRSENLGNKHMLNSNTSGLKGASWDKTKKKWQAKIMSDGKQIHLGRFNSAEEAHEAYCLAAKKYFGEFANFGRKLGDQA